MAVCIVSDRCLHYKNSIFVIKNEFLYLITIGISKYYTKMAFYPGGTEFDHWIGRCLKDEFWVGDRKCQFEGYIKDVYLEKGNHVFHVLFADGEELAYTFDEIRDLVTNQYHYQKAYFCEEESWKRNDGRIVLNLEFTHKLPIYKRHICNILESVEYLDKEEFEKILPYFRKRYLERSKIRKSVFIGSSLHYQFYKLQAAARVIELESDT